MTELFLKIVNMSISATWLVLAVLALRLILKKAPKWVNVLLWGIVAVRLICPFSIESALSLIPSRETISPEIMMDWTPEISTGIEPLDRVVNPAITSSFAPEPSASANPLQILIPVSANLWLLGILVMLVYTAVSYWRLRRKVSTAVILRDNIFQSENVGSPFVLGIFKPRIYLPFSMDGQNLNHVVAHEQAHIRRKDHWWKPLGFLLLTIHWFNPLMWVAYILLCRDIELACDEKVIKELGNEQRADYTQALVACSVNRRMIAACPLTFGEVGVKERVKSVMNYKKPAFWIVVTALVVCTVVAVCFLTDPVAEDSQYYWIESYLRDAEQTQVHEAYNRASQPLPVTIKFESTSGPLEIELIYRFKKNGAEDWQYSDPIKLHLGESAEFTVPADNHFNVTAMPISGSGKNGYVTFRFTEGIDENSDHREVIEWFDFTEDSEKMKWTEEMKCTIEEFPGITFKYTPYEIVASTSWEDDDTAERTVLISGMPIWNAFFSDLTGDGIPEICSEVSMGSGIIDEHVIIYDYANGVSYKLEDRGNYDYYLRMNDADGYLYVERKVYNSDELASSGRLVFKDGCIQVEGVQTAPASILRAKLLEIHDGYYLVEPVEGSWELTSADKIEVPIKKLDPSLEPEVGDILEIEYDGRIQETYPAKITEVYHISVVQEVQASSMSMVPTDTDLVGAHAGALFLPMDGNTYRYLLSDAAPEGVTADKLLYTFTEKTLYEGIGWEVYSLKEYPDLSAVLMISGANTEWLCKYSPPGRCSDTALQEAIDAGYVVMEEGIAFHGQDVWKEFYDLTQQGKAASVTIADYHTLDPDRCSSEYYETFSQDYPSLNMYQLSYDGKTYTLSFVSDNELYTKTYAYLMKYDTTEFYTMSHKTPEGRYTYVLTHDNTVTWDELFNGLVSSQMGAYIDHYSIYAEKKQ